MAEQLNFHSRGVFFSLIFEKENLWSSYQFGLTIDRGCSRLWKQQAPVSKTCRNTAKLCNCSLEGKHIPYALGGWGHQNLSSSSGCNDTPQGIIRVTWHLEEMLDNCHPQFWKDGWLTNSTATQGDSLVGRMIHMRTLSFFIFLLFFVFWPTNEGSERTGKIVSSGWENHEFLKVIPVSWWLLVVCLLLESTEAFWVLRWE